MSCRDNCTTHTLVGSRNLSKQYVISVTELSTRWPRQCHGNELVQTFGRFLSHMLIGTLHEMFMLSGLITGYSVRLSFKHSWIYCFNRMTVVDNSEWLYITIQISNVKYTCSMSHTETPIFRFCMAPVLYIM